MSDDNEFEITKELTKTDIKKILAAAVSNTKSFNETQEYVEDDKTYFERFQNDQWEIAKQAKVYVGFDEKEQYMFNNLLGAKQIIDTINTDPELTVLKKALKANDLSIDPFGKNYPVVYIEHEAYKKDNARNDVISIEPKDGSLIGNGYQVTVNHGADDVYASDIKAGLKEVQETLKSYAPEYREKKENKIKPKM